MKRDTAGLDRLTAVLARIAIVSPLAVAVVAGLLRWFTYRPPYRPMFSTEPPPQFLDKVLGVVTYAGSRGLATLPVSLVLFLCAYFVLRGLYGADSK
jgi:hypothetical protein